MISANLIHLIETNSELIIDRVAAQMRDDPPMPARSYVNLELRELAQELLLNLGHWISSSDKQELKNHAESLGALCVERETPLHRVIRAINLLREKLLDFAEEHMLSFSSVELYSEEQLNRRASHFFDTLIVHLVIGYERALRGAAFERLVAC